MTVERERLVASDVQADDLAEGSIRPKRLDEFVGQAALRQNLSISVQAAHARRDPLDHVLFYGPPGLGKTTLGCILAEEMGVRIKITSGPAVERPGDLAAILTNLNLGDVLFIDEVHRLRREIEEVLYSAMEDFALDIVVGKGPTARTIRLALPPFTVVGATTRPASLSAPLRDRFGSVHRVDFYTVDDLRQIVARAAYVLGVEIDEGGPEAIARRARGTPRVALRLLRRVRDYAEVKAAGVVDGVVAEEALGLLQIDELGLDPLDRKVLAMIIDKFGGGPVGVDTVAAAVGEASETLEDVVEPYLLQIGFIDRTARGRQATPGAYAHLGRAQPREHGQTPLF